MTAPTTKKDVQLVEDNPADSSLTPTAVAPCTVEGEPVPPGEGTARSRARRTQALPPLAQPRDRGWSQILLLLAVLGLLARVASYKEPTGKLSSNQEKAAVQPSLSAPMSKPESGTSPPPLLAAPAATGQSPSASSLPLASSSAVDAPAGEPGAATAPRVPAPGVRPAPQSHQRPGTSLHRLHIRAKQEAQLLITIDGQRTIEFLLHPGQSRQWSAQRDFTLTSRNGGKVVLTLDGHQMPPLGNSRQRVRYIRPPDLTLDARQQARYSDRNSEGTRLAFW